MNGRELLSSRAAGDTGELCHVSAMSAAAAAAARVANWRPCPALGSAAPGSGWVWPCSAAGVRLMAPDRGGRHRTPPLFPAIEEVARRLRSSGELPTVAVID